MFAFKMILRLMCLGLEMFSVITSEIPFKMYKDIVRSIFFLEKLKGFWVGHKSLLDSIQFPHRFNLKDSYHM